jgi:hypothetical protein
MEGTALQYLQNCAVCGSSEDAGKNNEDFPGIAPYIYPEIPSPSPLILSALYASAISVDQPQIYSVRVDVCCASSYLGLSPVTSSRFETVSSTPIDKRLSSTPHADETFSSNQ